MALSGYAVGHSATSLPFMASHHHPDEGLVPSPWPEHYHTSHRPGYDAAKSAFRMLGRPSSASTSAVRAKRSDMPGPGQWCTCRDSNVKAAQ